MKYAVISAQGKQYKVSEGDTLTVDKMKIDEGEKKVFDKVLLVVDGKKISVGEPFVNGAKVSATATNHKRGDKIRVAKFKAKSRYRKVIGHRQEQTVFTINSIS